MTHSKLTNTLTHTHTGTVCSPWPVELGDVQQMRGMNGSEVCCGSKVVKVAWSVAHVCLELCRFPDPDSLLDSPSCQQPGHPGRTEEKKSDSTKMGFCNQAQNCKDLNFMFYIENYFTKS